MRWMLLSLLLLAQMAAAPARADMYQDGSNAKQPQALNNIGKVGGSHYAPAYGTCTWDATSDVAPCINAAIAAAASAGGGTIDLPAGTYGISGTVLITASNIGIRCNHTELTWLGTAGGRMMQVAPPYGDTAKFRLTGNSVKSCTFNGNGAADGLYLASLFTWTMDDLKFYGPFNGGNILSFDVVPAVNGSTFGEPIDIQDGVARGLLVDGRFGTSRGIYLGSHMTSSGSVGNASVFRIDDYTVYGNGAGTTAIYTWGADNVRFGLGRVFNTGGTAVDLDIATLAVLSTTGNTTNASTALTGMASTANLTANRQSITGPGIPNGTYIVSVDSPTAVTLSQPATATASGVAVQVTAMFASGSIVFEHLNTATGAAVIARGQTTYPGCSAYKSPVAPAWCTAENQILRLDQGNGSVNPTVEPGADLKWTSNYGFTLGTTGFVAAGQRMPGFYATGSSGLVHACRDAYLAKSYYSIMYLCQGDAELMQFDTLAGDRFVLKLGGAGPAGNYDLQLVRPEGTGRLDIGPQLVASGGLAVPTMPTSCAGMPAGTLRNNAGVVNICP